MSDTNLLISLVSNLRRARVQKSLTFLTSRRLMIVRTKVLRVCLSDQRQTYSLFCNFSFKPSRSIVFLLIVR